MTEYTERWEQWVGSTALPVERVQRGARITKRDGRHDHCAHRLGGPAGGGILLKFGLPGFVWRCGCPCHHDPHRAGRLF